MCAGVRVRVGLPRSARVDRRIVVVGSRVSLGVRLLFVQFLYFCILYFFFIVRRAYSAIRAPAAPPPVANQCVLPSPPVDGRNTRYRDVIIILIIIINDFILIFIIGYARFYYNIVVN